MTKIKTLIIGCGKIAGIYEKNSSNQVYSHARALSLDSDYELVSCCDINTDRAKKLAIKYGFKNFGNDYIDHISKYKIDLVSICTPDSSHYKITEKILNNSITPKVIFLEKPVCSNLYELKNLIHLSKKKDVKIFVNHTRRYDTKQIQIKKLIQSNYFGKLFRADIFYYSGWQHNGIHVIDTLNFLFDDTLKIIRSGRFIRSPYPGDYTIDFELMFEKLESKVFLYSIDERFYQLFEFDLKFENARLRIEDFGERIIYEQKYVNEMRENVLKMGNLELPANSLSPIQNAFILMKRYILNGENTYKGHSIEDIYEVMTLLWKGKKWIKESI